MLTAIDERLTAAEIQARKAAVIAKHGPWTAHDIHLGQGVYTTDIEWKGIHPRTAKLVRAIHDLVSPNLHGVTVLDLGCLEGLLTIETGLFGCRSTGVEVRTDSLAKANFAKDMLGLDNIRFMQGDAMKLDKLDLPEIKSGGFDVTICCGLFYHFDAPDLIPFLQMMHRMTKRLFILDTHFAFDASEEFDFEGKTYRGYSIREHCERASKQEREDAYWASFANDHSFIPTKTGLLNMMHDAGFSTVFESHFPAHPHVTQDRGIFFGLKGSEFSAVNWPEHPQLPDWRLSEIDDRPRLTRWPDLGPIANRHTRPIRSSGDRQLLRFLRKSR